MTQSYSISASPVRTAASPPPATRTKLLLEGPILSTLLRLAAPNILNLLAFVGVIVFDGFFLGRISTAALAGASLAFARSERARDGGRHADAHAAIGGLQDEHDPRKRQ